MGSKLRKLRAKAGVTGSAYQKRQREEARRKERAGRVRVVGSASGRLGLEVAVDGAGKIEPKSKAEIETAFVEAIQAGMAAGALPFVPTMARIAAERRILLAHILGSHDGAEELADAIDLAAAARARVSVDSADDFWEQALVQLRSGVATGDLTVFKGPKGFEVHAKAHESAASLIAQAPPTVLAVETSPETRAQLTEILETGGLPRVNPAPPSELVKTTVSGVYEPQSIELTVGGKVVPQVPERRPPGMRMSRVLPLLAVAMMAGLAVPPKGER